MTQLFHHYQMQKTKELLKGHSVLQSLGIMSTFSPLKFVFKELALPAEVNNGVKLVCTALRSPRNC